MRMSGTFERRETAWRWPLLLPVPDLRSVAHVALRGPEHEGPGSLPAARGFFWVNGASDQPLGEVFDIATRHFGGVWVVLVH